MKRVLFVVVILLLVFAEGKTFAFDMPGAPTDIDISNATFEKVDATKFRIRHALAPGYPDSYSGELLWNRDQLLFQPVNVGKETSASSGKTGVAIVGKGGAVDYTDPIVAMNAISTWCGTPSETNPCLMKILPGVYDIGTNSLAMRPYVDLEGSGENTTRIKGASSQGVVWGAGPAEVRSLTIQHIGSAAGSQALMGVPELKINNATIIVTGATTGKNCGVCYYNDFFDSPPSPPMRLKNVTVNVSGGDGVLNAFNGGEIIIEHSAITGLTNAINTFNKTSVANSQLNGPIAVGSHATMQCAAVYDENFAFYANTCP